MFGMSPGSLLVILAIVLLVFGGKRLRSLGGDLGTAIKGFKKAMDNDKQETKTLEKTQSDENPDDSQSNSNTENKD